MRTANCITLLTLLIARSGFSGDWPMWRYDAERSGASPSELAPKLYLQWAREYPPQPRAWKEPVNRHRMSYDKCYEPIVMGQTLLFGSARADALIALDTRTGAQRWRYRTDGPVRLPPAGLT